MYYCIVCIRFSYFSMLFTHIMRLYSVSFSFYLYLPSLSHLPVSRAFVYSNPFIFGRKQNILYCCRCRRRRCCFRLDFFEIFRIKYIWISILIRFLFCMFCFSEEAHLNSMETQSKETWSQKKIDRTYNAKQLDSIIRHNILFWILPIE